MLSTKIRSAAIALVASAGLVTAALAPAVSQAVPKGGGVWENTCQNAQVSYENARQLLDSSTDAGEFRKNQLLLHQIEANAWAAGCSLSG